MYYIFCFRSIMIYPVVDSNLYSCRMGNLSFPLRTGYLYIWKWQLWTFAVLQNDSIFRLFRFFKTFTVFHLDLPKRTNTAPQRWIPQTTVSTIGNVIWKILKSRYYFAVVKAHCDIILDRIVLWLKVSNQLSCWIAFQLSYCLKYLAQVNPVISSVR